MTPIILQPWHVIVGGIAAAAVLAHKILEIHHAVRTMRREKRGRMAAEIEDVNYAAGVGDRAAAERRAKRESEVAHRGLVGAIHEVADVGTHAINAKVAADARGTHLVFRNTEGEWQMVPVALVVRSDNRLACGNFGLGTIDTAYPVGRCQPDDFDITVGRCKQVYAEGEERRIIAAGLLASQITQTEYDQLPPDSKRRVADSGRDALASEA